MVRFPGAGGIVQGEGGQLLVRARLYSTSGSTYSNASPTSILPEMASDVTGTSCRFSRFWTDVTAQRATISYILAGSPGGSVL
jgi:hypothetical protein